MSDFSKKQPAPASGTENEYNDRDDASVPVTGFSQAPSSDRGPTGPGEAIPANRKTIR